MRGRRKGRRRVISAACATHGPHTTTQHHIQYTMSSSYWDDIFPATGTGWSNSEELEEESEEAGFIMKKRKITNFQTFVATQQYADKQALFEDEELTDLSVLVSDEYLLHASNGASPP